MSGKSYQILDKAKWGKLVVNQFRLFSQDYNFGKFILQRKNLEIGF